MLGIQRTIPGKILVVSDVRKLSSLEQMPYISKLNGQLY